MVVRIYSCQWKEGALQKHRLTCIVVVAGASVCQWMVTPAGLYAIFRMRLTFDIDWDAECVSRRQLFRLERPGSDGPQKKALTEGGVEIRSKSSSY